MKHFLRIDVLREVPVVEITEESFRALQSARKVLLNAFAIEEKYDIVITNFLRFEKAMLAAAATSMVRNTLNYSEIHEFRFDLSVCAVNFLTAARLYLDHMGQNVRGCLPHMSDVLEITNGLRTKEFEENKSFRFMEALRNHVQHRGLPIHWWGQNAEWTSTEADGLLEHSVEVAALRSYLEDDVKFNKRVLDETEEKVDLKQSTRSYVESLSNIHKAVRELTRDVVAQARGVIEDSHAIYARQYPGKLLGLKAFECEVDRELASFPLLLEWDDIRVQLQNRNSAPSRFSKKFVTSQPRREKSKQR